MIHFILGGARSGKSSFAEKEVVAHNGEITYIATATADDEEMMQRIVHHKNHRTNRWKLIEEPFFLSDVVDECSKRDSVILIDCLTLWISNWMCKKDEIVGGRSWEQEKKLLLDNLTRSGSAIYLVSNEIGSGIIPMGELTRDFVDQTGWINQAIAQIADKVTLVVAGLPLVLKGNSTGSV